MARLVLVLVLTSIAAARAADDVAPPATPPAGFERALVGLLDVPLIYGGLPPADAKPTVPSRMQAREQPDERARVVATLDRDGIARDDGVRRRWQRTPQCRYHESGYEVPALAVFEVRPGWYRIAIDRDGDRFGWIRDDGAYHALVALLTGSERLTYLGPAWRGRLHDQPGGRSTRSVVFAAGRAPQTAYRAIRPAMVGADLWIEVEVLEEVCRGEERVAARGWVPARDAAGALLAWYWSRGC